MPNAALHGLYHVSTDPVNKYDLLRLVADAYGVTTVITPDDAFAIDRSLDSARFRAATGYVPPSWPELIASMHASHLQAQHRAR
jgi:dTDP-4-dehydrorhamnose reductase